MELRWGQACLVWEGLCDSLEEKPDFILKAMGSYGQTCNKVSDMIKFDLYNTSSPCGQRLDGVIGGSKA